MDKRKQLCIKLPVAEAEQLMKMAKKNNITITEQVRRYIAKGMTVEAYQNDEEKILADMQIALKSVLDPQIERMVKINVKNSITSSISALHIAALLYRLTTNDISRKKLEVLFEQARRLGIEFVRQGQGSVDDFLKNAVAQINETWERE